MSDDPQSPERRARETFLTTVAHELRSPLSTMLMHAQMLKAGDLTPEDQRKTGEAIERATTKQTQIIDDLIDVARAIGGTLPHQPQPVSLASIAKSAADNFMLLAGRKGVLIAVDVKASADVTADPMRLAQAVRHIISNAVRFSPKGSTIAVSVLEENGHGVVRVKDAGPGVDAAWQQVGAERLFDRIAHPDSPRPKAQGGIGYGLSVAHYIVVDQHHGKLALEDTGPQGAVFSIAVPLRKA